MCLYHRLFWGFYDVCGFLLRCRDSLHILDRHSLAFGRYDWILLAWFLAFAASLCFQYSFKEGSSGDDFPLTRVCLSILNQENFSKCLPVCLLPNTQRSCLSRLNLPQYRFCRHFQFFFGCVRLVYLCCL